MTDPNIIKLVAATSRIETKVDELKSAVVPRLNAHSESIRDMERTRVRKRDLAWATTIVAGAFGSVITYFKS